MKMRKTYKFSHKALQGGLLYSHRCSKINNKEGLRNMLGAIVKKYSLIDVTIKIYDTIFFLFFMCKPTLKSIDLIEGIQKKLYLFGNWDKEYLYTTIYDLNEQFLRNFLKKHSYDFDKG